MKELISKNADCIKTDEVTDSFCSSLKKTIRLFDSCFRHLHLHPLSLHRHNNLLILSSGLQRNRSWSQEVFEMRWEDVRVQSLKDDSLSELVAATS